MKLKVMTCSDKNYGWIEDESGENPILSDNDAEDGTDPIYMPIELAQLFAAAPDLLAACKHAEKELREFFKLKNKDASLTLLQQAIAKAVGKDV